MNQIIEIVQRIGVFMILGETMIHFCPGQNYEKYIRLIMEMMMISMLLLPFVTLIKSDVFLSFQSELQAFETSILYGTGESGGMSDTLKTGEAYDKTRVQEVMENAMQQQATLDIQEVLQAPVQELGYMVRYVELSGEKVVVCVREGVSERTDIYIDPVETVTIGVAPEAEERLTEVIAGILGIEQSQVVVR